MTIDIRLNKLEMDSAYTPVQDYDVANKKYVDDSITAATNGVAPIGAILAVTGTFSAANNGGSYNETGVTVGADWKLCDGSLIADAASPFNGRFVPKLDDGRFLRGNSSGGSVGGQATLNPSTAFAAAGNYNPGTGASISNLALGPSQIPAHTHTQTGAAAGGGNTDIQIRADCTGHVNGPADTAVNTPSGGTHSHTFTGVDVARSTFLLNSSVNIEPQYLNAKFYQRIK